MNKQIMTLAAGFVIAASSCTKKGSSSGTTPSTTSPTLNGTESSLLGTWVLKSVEMDKAPGAPSNDTTITTANSSFYMQFTKDEFTAGGPANYKKGQESFMTFGLETTASHTSLVYWYYDNDVSKLVIGNRQYDIISSTISNLDIKFSNTAGTSLYHFKK